MITQQEVSGKWKSVVGAIKSKYGQITDDDFRRVEGNAQQLIGLIQQKTGQTQAQVEAFVNDVCTQEGASLAHLSDVVSSYAESASDSLRDGYKQVAKRTQEGVERSADFIADRPVISVGTAFGVGLITGVAIGLSIAANHRPEPTWRDRWNR